MSDELPPNNPMSERGLLACVMQDYEMVMPEIRSIPEAVFYDERHRIAFRAICESFDSERPCDEVGVIIALRQMGLLEQLGGMAWVSELVSSSPSPHNWSTYFEDLKRDMILRKTIQFGVSIKDRALKSTGSVSEILDAVETESLAIRQFVTPRATLVDWKTMRRKCMADYEAAMTEAGRSGLRTGFPDLDRVIGGLRAQEFIVLAGSPSAGKTSLALNVAANAALEQNTKTGIISLETSGYKVVHRFTCIASGASGARLLNGRPLEGDMDALSKCQNNMGTISEHVHIYDGGAANVGECVSMMRKLYSKGCRLFIVDYLQLLDANQKTNNGNERMTLVSKAIKGAAKELDCPVIGISSLNRQAAKENRAPVRSDLRETGQLEFDADVIILLHPRSQDSKIRTIEVNVDKNKDGETGKLDLMFFPECMRFKSASRVSSDDHP